MRGLIKGLVGAAAVAALGYGGYRLYKKYKVWKSFKPEIITVAEALKLRDDKFKPLPSEILEDIKKTENDKVVDFPIRPISAKTKFEEATEKLKFVPMRPKEMLYELQEDDEEDECDYYAKDKVTEEVRKGTDPNSLDALEQYMSMQTAEFDNGSNEDVLIRTLHRHPFVPVTLGDHTLFDAMLDTRIDFFGADSKWAKSASWGDLIMHYAERLNYHLEDGLTHWVQYLIEQIGIKRRDTRDEIEMVIDDLVNHDFTNMTTGLFGLFGLDEDGQIDLESQLEYSVSKRYSFEMEFNSFLGMVMDDDDDDN